MRIWKFDVPIVLEGTEIWMPKGAVIIHVGAQQSDTVSFWAIVDKDVLEQRRTFRVVGTGHEFAARGRYIGTVFIGTFVWHLLEVE